MRRRRPLANHRGSTVSEIRHRTVETNGIHMHIAESGAGPLVVLCHGFPESWYSWRHPLHALADAGFHAIVPDMRGYGQTHRSGRSIKMNQGIEMNQTIEEKNKE